MSSAGGVNGLNIDGPEEVVGEWSPGGCKGVSVGLVAVSSTGTNANSTSTNLDAPFEEPGNVVGFRPITRTGSPREEEGAFILKSGLEVDIVLVEAVGEGRSPGGGVNTAVEEEALILGVVGN